MIFIRLLLSITLFFTLFDYSNGQKVSTKALSENPPPYTPIELGEYLRRATANGFSGAVLVAKDGKIILRKGYGWADQRNRVPITADTVFDIGSYVKAFTATAIMQLEEQGKLSTSDSITKYFPNVPADKTGITLHHLLTHSSGFQREDFYDESTPEIREILKDKDKFVQRILSYPLAFKPGEGRSYSNTAFSFLAMIIEKLSGQSYEEYLREHLFKPAGMTETGYTIPRNYKKLVARGYNDGPTDYGFPWETQWDRKTPLWDLLGNGGMLSTLDDLHKWLIAVAGNKIVSQNSKDKMFTVHYTRGDQGYGWNISKSEDGKFTFVWRGGDATPQGWNMDARWYQNQNLFAIVLTNKRLRYGSLRRPIMANLVDIVLQNKQPQLPLLAKTDRKKLRKYEGTYKLEAGAMFHVKVDEFAIEGEKTYGQLFIGGEGQQAIDLLFSANQLPNLTKLSNDLNAKTALIIEALRGKDAEKLKTLLPTDVSMENAIERWQAYEKQKGGLQKYEILGTSPTNQLSGGSQTLFRLFFKNSVEVHKVTWRENALRELDDDRLQPAIVPYMRLSLSNLPLVLPFTSQSETDFATYDLFKSRTVNVSFTSEGNLIVHTKDGDVTAHKFK
ncbi:MAG TPA: serine hydrolase domain-containing protein [Pyrinomonadaceae bacterium]|jgi:CubicO group peptidase (beta-lactamase class C family)